MGLIGAEIAKMHKGDIIHGDLTTSNMMLRRLREGEQEARFVSAPHMHSFLTSQHNLSRSSSILASRTTQRW